MEIDRIDHLVLTVRDIATTCDFYGKVLGMKVVEFKGRKALAFGAQKINLHEAGREFEPKADQPTSGSADLCLIVKGTLDEAAADLAAHGVPVVEGPVDRTGATGTIRSLYLRDPDLNLVELSVYA